MTSLSFRPHSAAVEVMVIGDSLARVGRQNGGRRPSRPYPPRLYTRLCTLELPGGRCDKIMPTWRVPNNGQGLSQYRPGTAVRSDVVLGSGAAMVGARHWRAHRGPANRPAEYLPPILGFVGRSRHQPKLRNHFAPGPHLRSEEHTSE